MSGPRPRVLYIAYWGALEPLGQALLVPAVLALAARGARVTLLSYEKPEDAGSAAVKAMRHRLCRGGVRWVAARYHHKPQAPATLLDLLQGALRVLATAGWARYDIVHGRTLVGGALGAALAPLLGARFIFHNEGYWARERVDAGTWSANSTAYRIADQLEGRLFDRADAIFCLTSASRCELEARPAVTARRTPVVSVPSAVDLSYFCREAVLQTVAKDAVAANRDHENAGVDPAWPMAPEPGGVVRLIYAGTMGGAGTGGLRAPAGPGVAHRYRLDWMAGFAAHGLRHGRRVHLEVLTRAPLELVADILVAAGLPPESWNCRATDRTGVRGALTRSTAGLLFQTPGAAAHAGSPTKVGEYWAMGLPVLLTPGIGDTAAIAGEFDVGVLVGGHSVADWEGAWIQLERLLADPNTTARCRAAAAAHYDLGKGIERQWEVYLRLLAGAGREP